MPPARVATTGTPRAIRSTTTWPNCSGTGLACRRTDSVQEDRQLVEDAVGSTAMPSTVT